MLNNFKGIKRSSPTKPFTSNTSLNEPNLNSLTKSPTKSSIEKQIKQNTPKHIQNNSPSPGPSIRSKQNEMTSEYESNYKNSPQTKLNSMQSNESNEMDQSRKSSSGNFQKKSKSKIIISICKLSKFCIFKYRLKVQDIRKMAKIQIIIKRMKINKDLKNDLLKKEFLLLYLIMIHTQCLQMLTRVTKNFPLLKDNL